VLDIFYEKDFVHEVLDTSGAWEKENLFYVTELIKKIGHPFVEPLLDRLAEEQNRQLRQYFLELLPGLGDTVKDSAIKRINDHRWYVIRNLVIILRNLNDPSVADSLHTILEHPHPRVRDEVLRTLIKFNDPSAKKILLREMESNDSSRCLKAITLAGMTRHREASSKLVEFLNLRSLNKHTFSLKKASVYALAEIGDPSVLPYVEAALKKRSLLFRRKSRLLKTLIIDSLAKYPAPQVTPILQNIATTGPRGLAERASGVMNRLKGFIS
jgi:HEAT repeat protein